MAARLAALQWPRSAAESPTAWINVGRACAKEASAVAERTRRGGESRRGRNSQDVDCYRRTLFGFLPASMHADASEAHRSSATCECVKNYEAYVVRSLKLGCLAEHIKMKQKLCS